MWCKGSLIRIFFDNFDSQKSAISFQCQKCRCDANRSDTLDHAWYQLQVLDRLCDRHSLCQPTRKRKFLSYLGRKTIGEAHSVFLGSTKSMASIQFICWFSNTLGLRPVHYWAEWIGGLYVFKSLIRCCSAFIKPMCPSHILSNCVSMLMILWLCAEWSSGRVRSSCQSVFQVSCNCSTEL